MHDKPCPTLVRLLDLPEDERLLGPYRLVQQLGRGGFAPVWLAREIHGTKEFRTVAVKLFCVEQGAGASLAGREQIVEEARALCQVEHPNIVRFYSFQTDATGDVLGIVMEYARGSSLDRRLQSDGKLSVAEVVLLGIELASALAEVHRAGLVHRDVKPGNVIESKGSYKLIDFGIAAGAQRSKRDAQISRIVLKKLPDDVKGARLTAFADTLLASGDHTFEGTAEIPSGTLGYIDPDCIAHLSPATAVSDLYSLGALLYECLTGMVPAAAAAIVTGSGGLKPEVVDGREEPPPVLDVAPEVPPRLARLVDALLNPEAAKRPRSAAELRDDLVALREELAAPPPEKPPAPPRDSARGRAVGGVLAGALVLGTFVAVWLASRSAAPPPPAQPTSYPDIPDSVPPPVVATKSMPPPDPPVVPVAESPASLLVTEGQALLTEGDVAGALTKFRAARDLGAGADGASPASPERGQNVTAIAQLFVDHVTLATQAPPGPCTLRAFSHPRLGYTTPHTYRPSVAAVPRGAVVVWGDDHERPGALMKAYSVMIDQTGHPTSKTRDLTPEGEWIYRPSLLAEGDRVVLLYWDGRGRDPGVHVRWLNPDGRIAGAPVLIDRGIPGNMWPVMTRVPSGFVVAWQEDRVHEGSDQVFLRHLDDDLQPIGKEALATHVGTDAGARTPALASTGDALLLAYTIEKGQSQRLIALRRFGIGEVFTEAWKSQPSLIVGTDRIAPEAPHIACGKDGCFVVWHGAPSEAHAGLVDVVTGKRLWQKTLTVSGGHPAIAASQAGDLAVAYFDQRQLKIASLSGDGVGPASVVGRVSGAGMPHDSPRPWLAPGREAGEWYLAWQETEGGEPLVARVSCKM